MIIMTNQITHIFVYYFIKLINIVKQDITVMSRSQPKPKIIYKNINDFMRTSSPPTKPRFIIQKQSRNALSQVKQKPQILTTEGSKKKLKYIEKNIKQKTPCTINSTNLYSEYFNQIDVIFTDLEVYLFQAKEKALKQVRQTLKRGADYETKLRIQEKVEDIKKMSEYIKKISDYLVYNQVPQKRIETQPTQITYQRYKKSSKQNRYTEISPDDSQNNMLSLSISNSRARVNRRADLISNRKKTVYETILEESQSKVKPTLNFIRK